MELKDKKLSKKELKEIEKIHSKIKHRIFWHKYMIKTYCPN